MYGRLTGQLLAFFDTYVLSGAAERRKLTVGICSAAHAEPLLDVKVDSITAATAAAPPHGFVASDEEITVWVQDPDDLKRCHSLWPAASSGEAW